MSCSVQRCAALVPCPAPGREGLAVMSPGADPNQCKFARFVVCSAALADNLPLRLAAKAWLWPAVERPIAVDSEVGSTVAAVCRQRISSHQRNVHLHHIEDAKSAANPCTVHLEDVPSLCADRAACVNDRQGSTLGCSNMMQCCEVKQPRLSSVSPAQRRGSSAMCATTTGAASAACPGTRG